MITLAVERASGDIRQRNRKAANWDGELMPGVGSGHCGLAAGSPGVQSHAARFLPARAYASHVTESAHKAVTIP